MAPDKPRKPRPSGKPKGGGRLATKFNTRGGGAANRLRRRGLVGAPVPDLVAEARQRGITVTAQEAAYLRSEHWTGPAGGQLLALMDACEEAGVPYRLAFDHVAGEPVTLQEVEIRMRGN